MIWTEKQVNIAVSLVQCFEDGVIVCDRSHDKFIYAYDKFIYAHDKFIYARNLVSSRVYVRNEDDDH